MQFISTPPPRIDLPEISKPAHEHLLPSFVQLLPQQGHYRIREQGVNESTEDRRHREQQRRSDDEEWLVVAIHVLLVISSSWIALASAVAAFYQGNYQGGKSDD